jgi:hypothetical protein
MFRDIFWAIFVSKHLAALSPPGLPDGLFLRPKIPIWVNIRGPWNERSWYVLWTLEYVKAS